LAENGIAFQEFDVLEDQNAREEMRMISGQLGVPVITLDDDFVVGFDEVVLKEKLGI
jgi:glutaredoxin